MLKKMISNARKRLKLTQQTIAELAGKNLTNLVILSSRSNKMVVPKTLTVVPDFFVTYVNKGDWFHEEFGKDFVKQNRMAWQLSRQITRLKLWSESTAIKSFDYCTYCLVSCATLCDQETDTDGSCVIKPDRNRINKISFVKLKMRYFKLIRRQLKW